MKTWLNGGAVDGRAEFLEMAFGGGRARHGLQDFWGSRAFLQRDVSALCRKSKFECSCKMIPSFHHIFPIRFLTTLL